ncbi:hypothetical protein [Ornithinimicrobium sp. W1665]|uniref:hypothetical protein n=1 Tax=Ornithinimicrobium sp. W1665 TaxID=3416666 RepID=UPI003CF19D75
MTTTTIDCQTCPVRGRHCGDCFVPVLGAVWLQTPTAAPTRPQGDREVPDDRVFLDDQDDRGFLDDLDDREDGVGTGPPRVRLDTDELAAVSAFVRAGLVTPEEASSARAELVDSRHWAAG